MKEKEFIAIISDMHLAPFEVGTDRQQSKVDTPEKRSEHLESIYKQLKLGPKPKAILFGGDNTNQPVSRQNFRIYGYEFMKRFENIGPCYAIPGNHDVGSTIGWHHHDPKDLDEACNNFGLDWEEWWTLEIAGFKIIAINSQIFGSGLSRDKIQSKWLIKNLKKPSKLIRAVFVHTPLYLKSPDDDFDEGSEQMCLKPQARRPLLEILRENPPELLITTHAHRFWISHQEKWDWLGIPATALGQDEMVSVPSQYLPPGDDHIGWVKLQQKDRGKWKAELCYC